MQIQEFHVVFLVANINIDCVLGFQALRKQRWIIFQYPVIPCLLGSLSPLTRRRRFYKQTRLCSFHQAVKRKVCDVKFAKCTYILHTYIYIYIKVLFNEMTWIGLIRCWVECIFQIDALVVAKHALFPPTRVYDKASVVNWLLVLSVTSNTVPNHQIGIVLVRRVYHVLWFIFHSLRITSFYGETSSAKRNKRNLRPPSLAISITKRLHFLGGPTKGQPVFSKPTFPFLVLKPQFVEPRGFDCLADGRYIVFLHTFCCK